MRRESNGVVVCFRCYDGDYDKQKHPQNFSIQHKVEPNKVPDGRPPIELTVFLLQENDGSILTENGFNIVDTGKVWTPNSFFGT